MEVGGGLTLQEMLYYIFQLKCVFFAKIVIKVSVVDMW